MQARQPISIVIPTLNEVDNVPAMLARIDAVMVPAAIPYEVVIVDDHSIDGTVEISKNLASKYPLTMYAKQGERGKAYSLLEGFQKAKHELIVMIDADLQYPPEQIVPMYDLMQSTNADVVVTNRQTKDVSPLRKLFTKVFNLIFARLLFGISFDTQSGLKLFRKEILNRFTMRPSPWSFDLEFLVRALENKYTIVSHDIVFAERSHGATKVKLLNVTFELAKASVQLWWRTSQPRIRAGYHANNRFLKKALHILMLTSLLAVANVAVQPSQVQSLALPETANSARNIFTNAVDSATTDADEPQTTTNQPTVPSTGITNPTAPSPSTRTTAPSNTSTKPSTTAVPNTGAPTNTNRTTSNTTASKAPPAMVPDQSNLMAATAMNAGNAYNNTYPNYVPTQQTNNRLFATSQVAVIAGLTCLIAAIIISGIKFTRTVGTSLATRN